MKTYKTLPKKYRNLKGGEVTMIDGYAYTIRYACYSDPRNIIYRLSEADYNRLRENARHWPLCVECPDEETLQVEMWSYIIDQPEWAYCQTELVF